MYSSLGPSAVDGGGGVSSPSRPLVPPGKNRYPLYRIGEPHSRSGQAENLVPTGIRSRTVQPVAQSLYRLTHPARKKVFQKSLK